MQATVVKSGYLKHNDLIAGWRGLSVLFVIIGHYVGYRFFGGAAPAPLHELFGTPVELVKNIAFRLTAPLGEVGVQFFFVISGYLISSLLAEEETRNESISLRAFYVRRIFRIMPALYLYLLAIAALRFFGLVQLDNEAFARSGAYLCNLSGFKCSWWLAHTWSLSVEEQFYIVWPFVFLLLGNSFRVVGIAAILCGLMIASYFIADLSSFAYIAVGALIALSGVVRQSILRWSSPLTILAALFFLVLQPIVAPWPQIANYIRGASPLVAGFVFFSTTQGDSPIRWLLLANPIQKLGLISYSAYLWQQLSTAPFSWGGAETGAQTLYSEYPYFVWAPLIIPTAISYFLVEKPMQAMGRNISNRIIASRTKPTLAISRRIV
jgi:peptidoglycan/LPS O-acetylase OafA/YrhL